LLKQVIDELAKENIFVFCVISDNAKAFQKAAGLFETQADPGDGNSDDEELLPEEGDPDEWAVLSGAMETLTTQGIFCVRCAAHSLQLVWHSLVNLIVSHLFSTQVLKDFEGKISAVTSAVATVRRLLDECSATPERTAKFLQAQAGLGLVPKQLCRIGQTRCPFR
jgi:hypothetical protein